MMMARGAFQPYLQTPCLHVYLHTYHIQPFAKRSLASSASR
jgi:hypothetical protein